MIPKQIIAVVNQRKRETSEPLEALARWTEAHHTRLWTIPLTGSLPIRPDEETLVLSLGGDGTFLRAAQLLAAYQAPLLGVNVGSLGFLTQVDSPELISALNQIHTGQYTIEERLRLEAEVDGERASAFNEIVLARSDINDFTRVDLYWEQEFIARYSGDGVIVATPSGSTAYSLAARGPIVLPPLECMLITPLNVHTLGLRPLVLPAQARLRAEMQLPGWLVIDGSKVSPLPAQSRVLVYRSSDSTRLIQLKRHRSFFRRMSEKLGWGSGPMRP
jgi:NAD+ kinase